MNEITPEFLQRLRTGAAHPFNQAVQKPMKGIKCKTCPSTFFMAIAHPEAVKELPKELSMLLGIREVVFVDDAEADDFYCDDCLEEM